MFAKSNRILQHRKLLESVAFKVQAASYLHSCNIHRILSRKQILNLTTDHRCSIINVKAIYAARLISTNVEEILNKADTAPSEPTEVISNTLSKSSSISSENVQSSSAKTSALNQTDTQQTAQPDGVISEFPIPEPPLPPSKAPEIIDLLSPIHDPPFEHLGLGGWSPVGLVQHGFEFLHNTVGLPWWGTIITATLITRAVLFPIVVISQRNSANMTNHLPKFQELQVKVSEAKQRGETIEAARYTQDLFVFMKAKGINPIKNAIIPLVQAPVFVSFFMGLREMANIPIKSMHNEGLFWFTDLTVPDQYYLLPIVTCASMWAAIEIGADTGKISSPNHHLIKYILRAMPVVVFPFSINFPGAILIYWVTSNSISLVLAGLFKVKSVRRVFKIEDRINYAADALPVKNVGFVKGVKKWWRETRTQSSLEDRSKRHNITFVTAGRGAVPKTFKYNPTLPRNASTTSAGIEAKKIS